MTPRTEQLLRLTTGERLARARKVAGFSQGEVAMRLSVDRRTIVRWETDVVVPSIPVMMAWATITEVPVEWLRTGHMPDADTTTVTLGEFQPRGYDLPLFQYAA
jgi:HTH-type transcriptional regulator, cell division transcriptional repressor